MWSKVSSFQLLTLKWQLSQASALVGEVRAASYGHTLGGAVGLAFVHGDPAADKAFLESGEWEVDIAGRRYPLAVSLRPMYDPGMERVRA